MPFQRIFEQLKALQAVKLFFSAVLLKEASPFSSFRACLYGPLTLAAVMLTFVYYKWYILSLTEVSENVSLASKLKKN